MDFTLNERETGFRDQVVEFIDRELKPRTPELFAQRREGDPWKVIPVIEEMKEKAKAEGLWNFFMPPQSGQKHVDDTFVFEGTQLTNLEYALCAEEMGRTGWSSECFNCTAPDTGNMELLHRAGTLEQKERWLRPLMDGVIRSTFLMTEPDVASSDATNIETRIEADGDFYILNGRKWWSSGVGDPRCELAIVLGKSRFDGARHTQQSMVLLPMDTPGVRVERMLSVFGYDHAPHGHGEVVLENVRIPKKNVLLGEGRGFEAAQMRLGPGRVHHCMRSIGIAEKALEAMAKRLLSRVAFGKRISDQSVWEERVARARIELEMTRLLCLKTADMMDRSGNKSAKLEIALIKVQAPTMVLNILDDAIQAHGGAGVSDDFEFAHAYASMRSLRFADGPDEVHSRAIAKAEFAKYPDWKVENPVRVGGGKPV